MRELAAEAFTCSEATRDGGSLAGALARLAAHSPRYAELREDLRRASAELARLAQSGITSAEFRRVLGEREATERKLIELGRELGGGRAASGELDAASLARVLRTGEAAVAFRRFAHLGVTFSDSTSACVPIESAVESLCAFVVRPSDARAPLALVDLGPVEPIELAVAAWREALGAGEGRGVAEKARAPAGTLLERGAALRELVFDPLLPALAGARRVVVVLDDVLHLVPLDALPAVERERDGVAPVEFLGEDYRFEVRGTLSELLHPDPAPRGASFLLALGGASFDAPPSELGAEDAGETETGAAKPSVVAAVLRGGAWESGFGALVHTSVEARAIAAVHASVFSGDGAARVLEGRTASRSALEALASRARFVHVATHGWFAPESIQSWSDPEPIDRLTGLGSHMSGMEQVKGMSPMLLCGLALAGANLPEDVVGRAPGLVTADELSTLDFSNCELVVLSACDTNVGERRAGQGVASLQKALQMAGARSVISSLWKVPDEATKELMLDFYRRLWVERKPKHQALWEAKTKLREVRDERGEPKYTTRDWAAWVLTGSPD
ncbi:MAG: CHAT domain-containing protein [Planctomycetota bacterium]